MTHCQCQQPLMSCSMPLFQGLRTTPLLDIFPDSLTKLPTICLYGLGFFANIVLLSFLLKSFNLLNINNMHNFLYINLLFISFCATARCDAGCRTIYYIWRASVLRLMHGSGFQTHYIFASPAWLPPSFQFSMVLPLRVSPVFFTVMV